MKICICGGGGLGTVCAGIFASQGHDVNILSGHPGRWSNKISVFDPKGKEYIGRINLITDIPEKAVFDTDIVILCVPGYMIEKTLKDISPFLKRGIAIGSVVSSTGFFFIAHEVLGGRYELFGFQRVPFISRVREYGAVGDLLGYKDSLNVAIENSDNSERLREAFEMLFMTPVRLLGNFYEASLTNSNPILHTGRLYSMWKDYAGEVFDKPGLFYADWTDEASETLIAMDNEFMCLVKTLGIKESVIPSLLTYYESTDSVSLTKKIRSIPAFKTIASPMIKVGNGWIPDFQSRYFTEDFPFGLRFIKELAKAYHIPTPHIDEVFEWGISKIVQH